MGPEHQSQDRRVILEACRHALLHNLGVAAGESVLVVTDAELRPIGEAFADAARAVTPAVELVEVPVADRNGREPPETVATQMSSVEVVLVATRRSLSWTDARLAATRRGARLASMTGIDESTELQTELKQFVGKEIGAFARPEMVQFAPGLPKTRSGKIMRRILRKIAANELDNLGDTSTLAEPAVVEQLIKQRVNR